MTTQEFIDVLEQATNEIVTDYSGRGMYGKQCVGFTVSDQSEAFEVLAECLAACEVEQWPIIQKAFRNVRTDSMGLDTIYYFPQFETEDN